MVVKAMKCDRPRVRIPIEPFFGLLELFLELESETWTCPFVFMTA